MARGGRRQGRTGTAYANRTDMHQPVTVAPGQVYGERQRQVNAQRAVPLPQTPAVPANPAPQAPPPAPGALPSITSPTARPGEPVQHGLPVGPGGGPSALGFVPSDDMRVLAIMRRMYMAAPTEGMLRAIENQQARVGTPS